MSVEQNYKNHARVYWPYHVFTFFPLVANFLWTAYRLRDGITGDRVMALVLAVTLLIMFFAVRVQILTVQDRVIRLEMRQRLRSLLPADLAARGEALPIKLLVALRFAGDAELEALVREALDGRFATGKDIKLRVQQWQGDFLRA
jgi:hypothetical protein